MADDDFTPDAPTPAVTQPSDDFVPDAAQNDFVPDKAAAPATSSPQQMGNAVTDIWPEIKNAASENLEAVKNMYGGTKDKGVLQQTMDVGKGLLAVPGLLAAPVTGLSRSVLGHGMATGEHLVGSLIAPETAAKDNPEEMYQHAKGDVDTAMSALRPAGAPILEAPPAGLLKGPYEVPPTTSTYGWQKPPTKTAPIPPPLTPERNPLGVTLTEGEATGDLAKRQAEQAAIRGADPRAQEFIAQREAQIADARSNVARGLDTSGALVTQSPLDAADMISQDLTARQDLARTGRQQEAAALQPPPLPHPLDAADTVSTSLRNSAETAVTAQQARETSLQANREALRSSLNPTGTVLATSPMEAADIVSGAVGQAAENAQAATNAAYDQLRALPGSFHPASFNTVGDEITAALNKGTNPIRVNPQTTPQAASAISDLEEVLSDATQQRDPETGRIIKKPPVTPQVIEDTRKRLNSFYGDALQAARSSNNWSDVRAMRGVMDAFDDAVTKRLTDGRFTGGNPAEVAATMRWARGQHAEYRKTFTPQGAGDAVGSAVQQIVGRHEGQAAPPNQIAGMLYGNGPLPVKVAKRLNSIFPAGSPENAAIKQGLFSHIIERPEGVEAWGPEQVANRIYDFLNGRGSALAREYLNPTERAAWKSYADNLRASVAPPPAPGDVVTRALGKITGQAGTPATSSEVADTLFGRQGLGENPLGVKLTQHIKDTYGEASEPFKAVQNGMAAKLLRTAEGRAGWDPEAIASNIDEFINGRGRPMANLLYTPEQQATWSKYADALRTYAKSDAAPSTPVPRAIARISGSDGRPPATSAEVRDMLWGRTMAQDKSVPVGLAKYLKNLYGENSPHWSALKQGLFQKMTGAGEGLHDWGPGRVANQINRFLNVDGRELAGVMFSPAERESIQAYADLMRKLEMPPGSYFPSAPGIRGMMSTVANRVGQVIGAIVGRSLTPGVPLIGEFAGITIGGKLERILERWHTNIKTQMPIIADETQKWAKAQARLNKNSNWATKQGALVATTALQKSLEPLGISLSKLPLQLPGTGGAEPSQPPQQRADGGATDLPDALDDQSNMVVRHTAPFPEKPEGYEYLEATKPGVDNPGVPKGPAAAIEQPLDTPPSPPPSQGPGGAGTPLDTSLSPTGADIGVPSIDTPSPTPTGPQTVPQKLFGVNGPRYQTWPERLVRSGTTLAGDVLSGQEPDMTGLRREDFTDLPRPGGMTVAAEPMDPLIERAQDMAGLAGASGLPMAEEGAVGMAGGKLKPVHGPIETTPGYVYHATSVENASAIADEGLLLHKPGDFTDQTTWPDGSVEKRNYFTPTANNTWQFAPESGTPVILRVPKDAHAFKNEAYTGDLYSTKNVPASKIEALTDNGWQPLTSTLASDTSKPGAALSAAEGAGGKATMPDRYLLPALKVNGKIYKGTLRGTHTDIPEMYGLDKPFESQIPQGSNISAADVLLESLNPDKDFGYINHKGQYLPRDSQASIDYALENGLVRPNMKSYVEEGGGLISDYLLSDTSKPGVALSALEHNAQPFYSPVEQAITNAPQQKMHGSQWLGWLKNQPGIKQEELDWLGLQNNPDLQGPVTKQQMLDHVQGQGVGLKEVEKGEKGWQKELNQLLNIPEERLTPEQQARIEELDGRSIMASEGGKSNDITKFSDYQLPGGENYREMLLTMPQKEASLVQPPKLNDLKASGWRTEVVKPYNHYTGQGDVRVLAPDGTLAVTRYNTRLQPDEVLEDYVLGQAAEASKSAQKQVEYRSSHWDEPNVLAHMRMNDRNIPDVGGSLHLEELQSDLHQAGRKRGYVGDKPDPATLEKTANVLRQKLEGSIRSAQPDLTGGQIRKMTDEFVAKVEGGEHDSFYSPEEHQLAQQYIDAWDKYRNSVSNEPSPVPNFPFKQSWPDLLLKRAITKAAREGKDAISWTPGKEQAKRYPDMLRQQIREIAWAPASEEGQKVITARPISGRDQGRDVTFVVDKAGKVVDGHPDTIGKPIDAVFGKGMAEKIMAANSGNLQPQDFVLGGHGMEMFYDKMLVDKANAIGKKYGAKVEWKELNPPANPHGITAQHVIGNTWKLLAKDGSELGRVTGVSSAQEAIQTLTDPGTKGTTAGLKVPVLRLTPKLKEQALSRGMPLFSDTAKPGAALGANEAYSNQQDIPGPVPQQPHPNKPGQEQVRAHGGRVNPANVNHAPSEAQKHAGNYAKDLVHIHGLEISVENSKGAIRKGIDKNGQPWECKLPCAYGYFRKTSGADGDHVDVFLGPHLKSNHVYLIDQVKDDTKKWDEHKVLLGFGSQVQALNYYKRAFSDGKGAARIGAIHGCTVSELKHWLNNGDTKTPFKPAPAKKLSHAEVTYEPHAKHMENRCSKCVHFVPSRHGGPECVLVSSPISPLGWCNKFRRLPN